MEEVTLQEFAERLNRFNEKHNEYVKKLLEINKSQLSDKEKEKQRRALQKVYKGYTSVLDDPNFFTELNEEYIQHFEDFNIGTQILNYANGLIGRRLRSGNQEGLFLRPVVAMDDYLFEILTDNGDKAYLLANSNLIDIVK